MITKKEMQDSFNKSAKQLGQIAAKELGQRIIDRAKWCEETGQRLPCSIMELSTLLYSVQLNYIGRLGDEMVFSLVDIDSPEGRSHGYPKSFFGDTEAFFMEIVRELEYIDSIHK